MAKPAAIMHPSMVVRLTVERMQSDMLHHLQAEELGLEAMLEDAVRHFLSSGEMEKLVIDEVDRGMRRAAAQAVSDAMLDGELRAAIKGVVLERLKAEVGGQEG